MWHLVFLAFFAFSILRFLVYFSDRRPHRRLTSMSNSRRTTDLHDIAGEIRGETQMAFKFYDGRVLVWLPKSQCEWDPTSQTMTVPAWLAVEKGLL